MDSGSHTPELEAAPPGRNVDPIESDETGRSFGDKPDATTTIAHKIDLLRRECGWSFDQLAAETGIDKKSILSHVNNGVKPRPRIRKEYAQAFSKALGRPITPLDLEK